MVNGSLLEATIPVLLVSFSRSYTEPTLDFIVVDIQRTLWLTNSVSVAAFKARSRGCAESRSQHEEGKAVSKNLRVFHGGSSQLQTQLLLMFV